MKVSVLFVIYEGKKYIKPVFDSVFAQTHKDLEVIAVINKSTDGGKEEIAQNYPQVKIIEEGRNMGFAEGNNVAIHASTGEFVQLVNQDVILEPDYIEKCLQVFEQDYLIAGVTGKILKYDFNRNQKTNIIDTTGQVANVSGRVRDRGQNEVDTNQYNKQEEVFGISGACVMYKKQALEKVMYCEHGKCEYYDEDFFMYWEDADLSWRINNAGLKNIYAPQAVAYHGRTAGQSEGGYWKLIKFIKHHKKLDKQVLRWNYKNHILMYIKNAKFIFHPQFLIREFFMLGYIVLFETSTLKVIPDLLRTMPKTLRKRRVFKALMQ